MRTASASAPRPASSDTRPRTRGHLRWYLVSEMGLGLLVAVVGLSHSASASIGAPFASIAGPWDGVVGIGYWTVLALVASMMVVKMRNGSIYGSFIAFVVAAAILGGPPAAVVVSFVGTFEIRELRECRPRTIATNHVEVLIGAVAASFTAGWASTFLTQAAIQPAPSIGLLVTAVATFAYMLPSTALAYAGIARDRRRPFWDVA